MFRSVKNVKLMVLIAALAGIGIYVTNGQPLLAKLSLFSAGSPPVITNAFLDKEKYFPGEQMTITAESTNASEAKAFVENENGFSEIGLIMTVNFNNKKTWMGKWDVRNSLSGKKYNLIIVAYNKSGSTEKTLKWEDPNPGHPWNQIDSFPAACGAGQYVSGVGASLTCSTPAGFTGCTSTSYTSANLATGANQQFSKACPAGKSISGGGCSIAAGGGAGEIWDSHPFNNTWWCTFDIGNVSAIQVWAVCC